jgi:dihydrolipoamide dehydrogenase
MAVGQSRSPTTSASKLWCRTEKGYITIDPYQRTNVPGIYAIGDVVPTPWLAHVASAEGVVAVEHMAAAETHPLNYDQIPGCTYCAPEVASIGLTEAKARERGFEVNVGKFPFSAIGKARIINERSGFVKIVADKKYDEVLGVHIVGPKATELIAEAGAAMKLEATSEDLVHTIRIRRSPRRFTAPGSGRQNRDPHLVRKPATGPIPEGNYAVAGHCRR